MSISVNKVTLLGNIGKDAELKVTGAGTKIASLSLATNERYKGKNGEFVTRTEWHNLVAFGRTAEVLHQYTGKGSKVYIEGTLRTNSWDDQQSGKKQYRTQIVVEKVSLLDSTPGAGNNAASSSAMSSNAIDQNDYANVGITDDDIPF